MTHVLQAESVDFAYERDVLVLEGVSATVRTGAMTGIVGPNGSGKSTLLRVLCGLLKPGSGEVTLDRAPLLGERNGVGYYRREPRYRAWEANLAAAGVDLLVVRRLPPWNRGKYRSDERGFPLESVWAERHPERFRRVYASPVVRIYEHTPPEY